MVTGCFEGVVFVAQGLKGGGFDLPQRLRDSEGHLVRVGQSWNVDESHWESTPGSLYPREIGISAFPVDWNADGLLDLLLGTSDGRIYVRLNEGTREAAVWPTESLQVQVAGEPALLKNKHAMPVAADWDGDGRFDLVTGSDEGGVFWFRNVGKKGTPAFAAAAALVPDGHAKPGTIGERTQVAVVDFDADGDLDLVVGDYHSNPDAPEGQPKRNGFVWLVRRN